MKFRRAVYFLDSPFFHRYFLKSPLSRLNLRHHQAGLRVGVSKESACLERYNLVFSKLLSSSGSSGFVIRMQG